MSYFLRERELRLEFARRNLKVIDIMQDKMINNHFKKTMEDFLIRSLLALTPSKVVDDPTKEVPSGKWAWLSMKDDPPPDSLKYIYVSYENSDQVEIVLNPLHWYLLSKVAVWSPVFIPPSYKQQNKEEKMSTAATFADYEKEMQRLIKQGLKEHEREEKEMSKSQQGQETLQNICDELRKIFGDMIPKPQPEEEDDSDDEESQYRETLDYLYKRLEHARSMMREVETEDEVFKSSAIDMIQECIDRVFDELENNEDESE